MMERRRGRCLGIRVLSRSIRIIKILSVIKIKLLIFKFVSIKQGDQPKSYIPTPGQYVVMTHQDKQSTHIKNIQESRLHTQKSQYKSKRPLTAKKRPMTGQLFKQEEVQYIPNNQYISIDNQVYYAKGITEPIITKDLKTIVKKQDLRIFSPSAHLMKEVIDQRQQIKRVLSNQMSTTKNKESQKKIVLPVVNKQQQNRQIKRPVSSKIFLNAIKEEKIDNAQNSNCKIKLLDLKKAFDYDKKKREEQKQKMTSSFIPISKHKQIKHISGFNTIKLTRKDIEDKHLKPIISRQSPFLYTNKNLLNFIKRQIKRIQPPYEKKGYFLPVDYYIFDEQQAHPAKLMQKYKNPQIGSTYGYSKWFFTDGNYQWRRCLVHHFDEQKQRFLIEWFSNQIKKYVSRVNLRFQDQDENKFKQMVKNAQYNRQMSQIYMKYNYMIDKMQSLSSELQQKVIQKIKMFIYNIAFVMGKSRDPLKFSQLDPGIKYNCKLYLNKMIFSVSFQDRKKIKKNFNQSLMLDLINQIKRLFIRTNRQIEFNFTLPYSQEKQEMFKEFLDQKLFKPIISQPILLTKKQGVVQVCRRNQVKPQFLQLFKTISNQAHIANPCRLTTLQRLSVSQQQILKLTLVLVQFSTPIYLQRYIQDWQLKFDNVCKKIASKISQSEDYISNEAKPKDKYLQLTKSGMDKQTKNAIFKFQFLVNHKYQLTTKSLFSKSVEKLFKFLETPLEKLKICNNLPHQSNLCQQLTFQMINVYQTQFDFAQLLRQQLLIQIKFYKDDETSKILMTPDISFVFTEIQQTFDKMVSQLQKIGSVRRRQIGNARRDNQLHIFPGEQTMLQNARDRLKKDLLQLAHMGVVYYKQIKNQFQFLIQFNIESKKKYLKKASFSDFQNQLRKLKSLLQQIDRKIFPRKMRCGILYIDCEQIKLFCKKKIIDIADQVYKLLIQKIQRQNQKLSNTIEQTKSKLKQDISNLQELDQLRVYAKQRLNEQLQQIYMKINEIMKKMDLLSQMNYRMNYDDFEKSWLIYSQPLNVKIEQQKCLRRLKYLQNKYKDDLFQQQVNIQQTIQNLSYKLSKYTIQSDIDKLDKISRKFGKLGQSINNASVECQIIQRRQKICGLKVSDYKELQKIRQQFIPYQKVWGLAKNYQIRIPSILKGPLVSIDRQSVTNQIQQAWTDLFNLQKGVFKIIPHMFDLTKIVKKQYQSFKPYLPLINDLKNPDMRSRHWKKIAQVTGISQLQDNSSQTNLQNLLQRGIQKHKQQIRDISEIASKQLQFQKILNKMKREWKQIKFKVVPYQEDMMEIQEDQQEGDKKLKKAYLIKEVDKILDKLDEDIVKTQAIISSPFIKFLESQVIQWRNYSLFRAQQTIQLWIKTQRTWQYLHPIFSSKDIHRQLPKESSKYIKIDKQWRIIMDQTQKQPNVMECSQSKFKDNFLYIMSEFQILLKSLNEFLNKKRSIFPRFYFLSDQQLLSILSKARDVTSVQKHLNKCFEGINKVIYGQNTCITHIVSEKKQQIQLQESIITMSQGHARPVQQWLIQLDKMSKKTLSSYTYSSYPQAYQGCGQLIHLHQMLKWTEQTNTALKGQQNSLQQVYQSTSKRLLKVVRQIKQQKNKLRVKILTVMVVLMVHNRDILQKIKKLQKCTINSFQWIAQMRYQIVQQKKGNQIHVMMINTYQKYGWEYLGNQQRLVITPLTDRCYRTLMSALQMCLGGAPEGPAGTGKTQTVKDLAKAVAKHCVVFNCSESLDIFAMAKFFKGLTSCGSWVCFDQFNRIQLQVLSVIAQQILTIQTAIMKDNSSKISSRSFIFQGQNCPLDSSCAIFITMNPGYAGRTQLPDNLKALFRSVAMMIPSYAMITQILLYSYGFQNARQLSIKITCSLKLASQQLSTQSHYDFGMRNVKSIISAAGVLKQKFSQQNQQKLCVKAIKQCNLPKFTLADIPLFSSILIDLFPDLQQQQEITTEFTQKIKEALTYFNLIFKDQIHTKIMQCYQTMEVRHGTMIVGTTMAGKTSISKVLAKVMRAAIHSINPKSIPMNLLFGYVDSASNQWHDGISSFIFRNCVQPLQDFPQQDIDFNWIYFDGPVDAQWIQSMNTLLDDNKKLCLANGQTLKMKQNMKIVFEVDNLQQASPATVSRCGMVFTESNLISWPQLCQPWYQNLPQPFKSKSMKTFFWQLFKYILQPVIQYMSSSYKPRTSVYCQMNWLIVYLLRLFQSFMLKDRTRKDIDYEIALQLQKEKRKIKDAKLEGRDIEFQKKQKVLTDLQKTQLFSLFIFAVIWSVGAALDQDARKAFSKQFKHLFKRVIQINLRTISKQTIPPDDVNLFEVRYENKKWINWNHNIGKYQIPSDIKFHQINVPTAQSVRHSFIVKSLILHNFPILVFGKTGTAKTLMIKSLLLSLDTQKYVPTISSLSATTSSNQFQDSLQSKLQKQKRRKGVYGPSIGSINIIFVDDLNMPVVEKYGAQPPLELLRQAFGYNGWYDRNTLEFKKIQDIVLTGAMGMSRPPISNRLVRYFNLLYLTQMQDQTLRGLLKKIFQWGFSSYSQKIQGQVKHMCKISINLHKLISKQFLPLPRKSHYMFNLRDLMKIIQGVIVVPQSYYVGNDIRKLFLRLWIHQCVCIYSDRLCQRNDKVKFFYSMNNVLLQQYHLRLKQIIQQQNQQKKQQQSMLVSSFLFGNYYEPHSPDKVYTLLPHKQKLKQIICQYIAEYNQVISKKIRIVLFDDAIQLLTKINRIMQQPFGNALLVGIGGAGVKTLTKLSTYMQDLKLYQIDSERQVSYNQWLQFNKNTLKKVSLQKQKGVFFLSQGQIRHQKFIEDINNILNIGQIPNAFNYDQKQLIINQIKDQDMKVNITYLQAWEIFISRCKINLHVVLSLSPIGEAFTKRLRNFPSLVACTSCIWVFPWSESALNQVSSWYFQFQQSFELITMCCVSMHLSVQSLCNRYLQQQGRYVYVTGVSFMKMLQNYKCLYQGQKQKIEKNKIKYRLGVEKLNQCAVVVDSLKEELQNLKPVLIEKTAKTEEIMKKVDIQNKETQKYSQDVKRDQEQTAQKTKISQNIKNQCQQRLQKALPQLKQAMRALKTLTPKDFSELKTNRKPTPPIRLTLQALMIFLDRKLEKAKKGNELQPLLNAVAKQLNQPKKFVRKLQQYKIENVHQKTIQRLAAFKQKHQEFKPKYVQNASACALGLCKWVLAMFNYYHVNKAIQPLKNQLAHAQKQVQLAKQQLEKKRTLLKQVMDKLQELNKTLQNQNSVKQKLKAQINECEVKMNRAFKLTNGLAGQKSRWQQQIIKIQLGMQKILGNILLASGFMSYLTAFPDQYRQKCLQNQWIPKLINQKIKCDHDFSLIKTIGIDTEIQQWTFQGLPLDKTSRENAITIKNITNWPLIIDPQGQALKWIKKLQTKTDDKNLMIVKPNKMLQNNLQLAIRLGNSLIIHSMGQQIDPILQPILIKNIQKSSHGPLITIGNNTIVYTPSFRLYLFSNMNNPHYRPEILTKITLINFILTKDGLKDQMLSLIARQEDPNLEEQKIRIMMDNADNQLKLLEIQQRILKQLNMAEGKRILDDQKLVNSLSQAKQTSLQVEQRMRQAIITEERINKIRTNYQFISLLSSQLYFKLMSLSKINVMYRFSLQFYCKVYKKGIKLAQKPNYKNVKQRALFIQQSFKRQVYLQVSKSLFVKDKLIFSLLLALTVLECNHTFNTRLFSFILNQMLTSGEKEVQIPISHNPDTNLFSSKKWATLANLSKLNQFKGLQEHISLNISKWEQCINGLANQASFPSPYDKLTQLQKLCLVKIIRPQLVISYTQNFINDILKSSQSKFYTTPPTGDLFSVIPESSPFEPIIFLLSPGDDPQEEVRQLAGTRGTQLQILSLGKGQGPIVQEAIKKQTHSGGLVMLQNCHLGATWMKRLVDILQQIQADQNKKDKNKNVNMDFRIIITTMPTEDFPLQILQNSIKLTQDPPKGIKYNILNLYKNQNATKTQKKFYNESKKNREWKRLFMGLAYFHAVVRQRRRFGPTGWNIYYDFNQSDFKISSRLLKHMLQQYQQIPFVALKYLTGQCYYGGKVTQQWDRRLINSLLQNFYNPDVLKPQEYYFSKSDKIYIPGQKQLQSLQSIIEFIGQVQNSNDTLLFGMHQNSLISRANYETDKLMKDLIRIGSIKNESDKTTQIVQRSNQILKYLPSMFPVQKITQKYKLTYYQCMNIVLVQQILRYNHLLKIIYSDLKSVTKGLEGLIVMSALIDQLAHCVYNNVVPERWKLKAYSTQKSLLSYNQDLIKRIEMFNKWIEDGELLVYWINGFFFTQSFFTGIKQQYARVNKISVDKITFKFTVMQEQQEDIKRLQLGCYIKGLYLQCASWDAKDGLIQSKPGVIYQPMAIIKVQPCQQNKKEWNEMEYLQDCIIRCPVYKTTQRKGILVTTGHSTNFIISIQLLSKFSRKHWIQRGVALFAQLDD